MVSNHNQLGWPAAPSVPNPEEAGTYRAVPSTSAPGAANSSAAAAVGAGVSGSAGGSGAVVEGSRVTPLHPGAWTITSRRSKKAASRCAGSHSLKDGVTDTEAMATPAVPNSFQAIQVCNAATSALNNNDNNNVTTKDPQDTAGAKAAKSSFLDLSVSPPIQFCSTASLINPASVCSHVAASIIHTTAALSLVTPSTSTAASIPAVDLTLDSDDEARPSLSYKSFRAVDQAPIHVVLVDSDDEDAVVYVKRIRGGNHVKKSSAVCVKRVRGVNHIMKSNAAQTVGSVGESLTV
jgi:hypothetical protein